MSSFYDLAVNPRTKRVETALWIDDAFGPHRYGVKFPNDETVYDADKLKKLPPEERAKRGEI